jgi:hypothetical protein
MRTSSKNILMIAAMSVAPMLAFQNCSQVNFARMADIENQKVALDGGAGNVDPNMDVPANGDGSQTTQNNTPSVDPGGDNTGTIVSGDTPKTYDSSDDGIKDDGKKDDSKNYDDGSKTVDTDMPSSDDGKKYTDNSGDSSSSDSDVSDATCAQGELTPEEAMNDTIVQVACNGNSGKMCALICFQPNDNNPFVLTKKVNLKQVADGGAWANGPKANGRVANATKK